MAKEIERKFLVIANTWRESATGEVYRQGYLCTDKERTVRVRTKGNRGYLTIKGMLVGATRTEFEYEIPVAEANEMLDDLCEHPIIEKKRYTIHHRGMVWEVDEFEGMNKGLVIAEVELDERNQRITLPDWVGKEVTQDPRYYNANLTKKPYTTW